MSELSALEVELEKNVKECVQVALASGTSDLSDVLQQCQGADPILVAKLLVEERSKPAVERTGKNLITRDDARSTDRGSGVQIEGRVL
jgi:hypothetical protein